MAFFSPTLFKLLGEGNLLGAHTYGVYREPTLGTTEARTKVFHSLSLSSLLETTLIMTHIYYWLFSSRNVG